MYKTAAIAAAAVGSMAHPILPTSWTATVREAEVGVVYESEHFVGDRSQVSPTNPSAKWTNYTDGSCQRLIYFDLVTDKRFLLGCDAVDCCYELDEDRGPIEYQIPNVHPHWLAPVKSEGSSTIELFDGSKVASEEFTWKFSIANYSVFASPNDKSQPDGLATLHQWTVVAGAPYVNQYVNFTAVKDADLANFIASFQIPDICTGNILNCDSAKKQGKLSEKSYKLLRAGDKAKEAMHAAMMP